MVYTLRAPKPANNADLLIAYVFEESGWLSVRLYELKERVVRGGTYQRIERHRRGPLVLLRILSFV